jgi:uncharacterized membrane-anchored protein YitT (DUF2179 family)
MKSPSLRKEGKTLMSTIAGTLFIGVGIAVFINPQKLYSGGITGASQLIVNAIEAYSNLEFSLNLGLVSFLLQIPLMILGWFKLSKRFILYTILSVVLLSIVLALPIPFFVLENDPLAAALVGAILVGVGNGILYRVGTSSGGMSIFYQYLSLKTGRSVGNYQFLFNGLIIGVAGLLFGLETAIYTLISQLITVLVIDKVHTAYNFMKLEVITSEGEAMADTLAQTMPHGITVTDAVGWYTKQPKKMIHTVISVHEIDRYVKLIESIDPKAFIIMDGVSKVKGNFKKRVII